MVQVDKRKISIHQFAKVVQGEAFYTVAYQDPASTFSLIMRSREECSHCLVCQPRQSMSCISEKQISFK